jgi:CHAD domain-containing protein
MSGYFEEVRDALARNTKAANLHPVRLASKKIRYTLELFRDCYGAEFDQRMEALKDVQTALGDVNDAVASAALLKDVMPNSEERKNVREFLKKRAAEKAEEFRVHWTQQFDAAGEETRWLTFLRHPRGHAATARTKAKRPAAKKSRKQPTRS